MDQRKSFVDQCRGYRTMLQELGSNQYSSSAESGGTNAALVAGRKQMGSKGAIDIAGASAALVLFARFWRLSMVLMFSGGAPIPQRRSAGTGCCFRYKFRSMVKDQQGVGRCGRQSHARDVATDFKAKRC
jgi:lipopolysaccharide/colanic/teichoic acid biosynthesis glycosyltransferase